MRPDVAGVDVPIGLLGRGARNCDLEARRLLGVRRSSVFPAPTRAILTATSHGEASRIRDGVEQKRVSIQAWAIVPKVAEVDRYLRAHRVRSDIVREVHPEVSFFFLNGKQPMTLSKKKAAGRAERLSVLHPWCGNAVADAPIGAKEAGLQGGRHRGCVRGALDRRTHRLWRVDLDPGKARIGRLRPTDPDDGMKRPESISSITVLTVMTV